jgi:hypothetical protein
MTEKTKSIVTGVVVLTAITGVLWIADIIGKRIRAADAKRQAVICPSFLSLARSSRDTLIVMHNEPLCNRYVLENLR